MPLTTLFQIDTKKTILYSRCPVRSIAQRFVWYASQVIFVIVIILFFNTVDDVAFFFFFNFFVSYIKSTDFQIVFNWLFIWL